MKTLYLSALAAGLTLPFVVSANTDDVDAQISSERVLNVTASRSSRHSVSATTAITTITQDQIKRSGASSVADVLRSVGVVTVSDLYGDGRSVNVSARGFGDTSNSTTLVLVDGRRLNNQDIANVSLNRVALDNVERIEVIQDSASVLYGDQALGGVINIITKSGIADRGRITLKQGSYQQRGIGVQAASYSGSGLGVELEAADSETDNYRDHNEARKQTIAVRLGQFAGSQQWFVEYGETDDRFNAPGALFADELAADRQQSAARFAADFSDEHSQQARINGFGELTDAWGYELDMSWRQTDAVTVLTGSRLVQDRALSVVSPRFTHASSDGSVTVIGVDAEQGEYQIDSAFGSTHSEQDLLSLYARSDIKFSTLNVIIGGRIGESKNDIVDGGSAKQYDHNVWAAELGLRKSWSDTTASSVRVERVYRLPKVDELTFSDSPQLKASTGYSAQMGWHWATQKAKLDVSAWQLRLDDEIVYDPTAPGPFGPGANSNLEATDRVGLTIAARWGVTSWFSAQLSGSAVDASVTKGLLKGKDIPLVPDVRGTLSLDFRPSKAVGVVLEAEHVGKRAFSGDFNNSFSQLPAHTVINSKLLWQVGDFHWQFAVRNLADKRYSEYGAIGFRPVVFTQEEAYYPSPERNVWLGVDIEF